MGSSEPFHRSLNLRPLLALLFVSALGLSCGPDELSADGADARGEVSAQSLLVPRVDTVPDYWRVAPDVHVQPMLAGPANLRVTLLDSADPIAEGAIVVYSIDVQNLGPNVAETVSVAVNLPTQSFFQSFTQPTGWNCGTLGNVHVWTCTAATLGVNVSQSIKFTMMAPFQDDVLMLSSATITAATTDPVPGDNTSSQETVVGQNDAPVNKLPVPVVQTMDEDTELVFSGTNKTIGTSDVDVFDRKLQVTLAFNQGVGTLSGTSGLVFSGGDGTEDPGMLFEGKLVDINNALNGLRFKPKANFYGSTSIVLSVQDMKNSGLGSGPMSDRDVIPITVKDINDPPDAVDDVVGVPGGSTNYPINVLANDTYLPDSPETLTITAVTQPSSGSVTFTATGVSYTSAPGFQGTTTFTYTIADGRGGTDTATVTVTVGQPNEPPTANNDAFTVAEDSAATAMDVLANDTTAPDVGETLSVVAVTQPANGTVTFTPTNVSFKPSPDFEGTTTFTYTASDGRGGTATATVTVTVTPVNDPVHANNDAFSVEEDSIDTVLDVLANDSSAPDLGETLTVTAVTQPSRGVVTLIGGVVRYTPPLNYAGTTSFTYTMTDGNGSTATATVNLTITPVNDPPDAVDDAYTVLEDSGLTTFNVLANDLVGPELGETLSVVAVTQPANGTVTFTAGNVRFTPTANFAGVTTFTYTASDGNGGTDIATVTVTVTNVNDPPDAVNDSFTVDQQSSNTALDVLANDTTAPDTGETLTVTAVTQPANGTVAFTATGVTFTPAPGFRGITTFTYTISDGNGGTDTATVTVTVADVNDPPTANDDAFTVLEDSAFTELDVLANDSIAPDVGETLSISAVTQPANGTVNFSSTRVRFRPAANFNGTTTFTYTASDGRGGTDTATVTMTVTPVNDPPTAVNDAFTVDEHSTGTVLDVLANDTSAPDTGETLSVTAVTQPANGTVTFTATGVTFIPAPGFRGLTTFTYTISDGNGGTSTATVNVTVMDVNDPPTANDDAFTVLEDSAATVVDVLANDTAEPDVGETLFVSAVTQPANGTVTLNGTTVRFRPAANFFGTTTFTYTLSDNRGGTDTATVTMTVTPVNDPPTARNDAFSVAESSGATALDVLANDSFAPDDGETLSVTAVTQPANGTVTFTATGVTFTPVANYNGVTTFTYTISDGNGGTATATVTVTVTPVNDPPTANDDAYTVLEDSAATVFNVLANDTTAPDTGETLSISDVTQPANGTVTFTATNVSFKPAANFNGTTTFIYTVSDGNGGTDTATVTVTVTPVNDPPDAVDDAVSVAEDSGATALDVLANDTSAPDTGETLSIKSVTQPTQGSVTLTAGVVRYTPPANFNGTTTFTYTISDGNGGSDTATVTVTVTPVNDPPVAQNDNYTVAENSAATVFNVLANDTTLPDTGETLSISEVTQPAHGTVSFTPTNVSFTPTPGFSGTTTFTYTVSDGNGGTSTAIVTVTVTNVNDPPVAQDDAFTVLEDSGATVLDVLANDTTLPDTGETLTLTAVTQPANGTVTSTPSVVRFTPAANYNGTTTFTYTVSDGNGGTATATVTVTVTPVNDPPDAVNDSFTLMDTAGTTVLDVLANDTAAPDTGETLTVTAVTQPANGTVTFTATGVSFTSNPGFQGTTTFTYTISDGNGGTDTATVTVRVVAQNNPPVARDDSYTVLEDSAATVLNVLANDTTAPDLGEVLSVTAVTQPANGTVTFTAANVGYTPPANYNGTTTFTYTVSDGNGGTATATVTVTVTPVNDPPVAEDDAFTVLEDSGATALDVLANDTLAPDVGETLSIVAVTQPANGTVTLTGGVLRFTPAANFSGTTTFTYTVSDGNGGSDTATVTVTVTPVNDPPDAVNDNYTVLEDSGATVLDVLANDTTAPDTGETLTLTAVTQPANGTVTLGTGNVSYTPPANYNGTTTFTYTVSDGNGGTDTATVTVTVTPVNDPPVANDDAFTVAENSAATALDVLANDTLAPDVGETLSISAVTQPANGTVTLTGGVLRFKPATNFSGTTTFTYTVSDGNGGTATATVTVMVTPVNHPPDAKNDNYTVAENSGATVLDVLANDTTAPDTGETLTVTAVTQPANGTVTFTPSNVSFTPAANFNGTTTFTYTVSDGNGGTDTASVSVTVTPVNDPPTANDDAFTVLEDSGFTVLDVLANDTTEPDTGETLSVIAVTLPTHGAVTLTGGVVRFRPEANFNGTTTFTYTVSDGNNGTDTATVTVTVTPMNDPPRAVNDSFTVAEDSGATVLDVLANDTSAPDVGETLTIIAVTQPGGGTVTFTASSVSFTPAANFFGTTAFTYTISDGNGGTATATVTLNVSPVNDPPTANNDAYSVAEDSGTTVLNVLANDSSAPEAGETLTITAVTQPSEGAVTFTPGNVSYTPPANYYGVATFTYTISDGNGGTATATVTVTVTPVNDLPVANNDSFSVEENSGATALDVLANDSTAPDIGETLTITAVTQPANGSVTLTGGVVRFTPATDFNGTTTFTYTVSDGNGGTATATVTIVVGGSNHRPTAEDDSFTVLEDSGTTALDVLANDTTLPDTGETLTLIAVTQPTRGTVAITGDKVSYTPPENYFGATAFTYTVSDGNGGTDTANVTVTVTPVNDPPTANDDAITVAEDSGATVVDVLANDSTSPETGESLRVTAVTQPANGTVTFTSDNVTFTPAANYSGTTSFTYTVTDGGGASDEATVTVTVTPVNDPPDAVNDTFTMSEDLGPTSLDVLANDTFAPDTGETLTITGVTQPANGSVSFTATDVTFTPDTGFRGTTTFTYSISDGNGGTDTATVTVTVTPVNRPPTAGDDAFTVAEDSGATVLDVLANDSTAPDLGETLSVVAVTQPAQGTVTFTATEVSYTPPANFFGTASFTYTASDGRGGTDTATVVVTVTPVNDPPTANDDSFTVAGNSGPTALNVLINDTITPDVGETLRVTAVTQPANGTVTFTAGNVSFTPATNFSGTTTFTYTISDGNGGTATATVTVIVGGTNRPPTANDDSFTLAEDSGTTVLDVLVNDTAAPDTGETLSILSVTQPANATVAITADKVSFTPAANFNGITTFTYTVSDGNGGTDTAIVTVSVTPVNDPPTANDDAFSVLEDSGFTVLDVRTNDTAEPDTGETLAVSAVTQPAHGQVTLITGTVRFRPETNYNGTTTFTYTLSDGNGGTDTATVTVTVTPVNDPPTAVNDSFTVAEDSAATVMDVLANDRIAPDTGETLTVTSVTQPANGTVTFTAANVSFTPAANFNGSTSFAYTISDGNGGTATATVTVTVTPVNDPPVANDDAFTVAENSGPTLLDVLLNDTSAPDVGETLTVASVTPPVSGTVALTGNGVSFTPAPNFEGSTTFTYTVSDGHGGTDSATVTVTVEGTNNPPVANDDAFTVAEDSAATEFDVLSNDTFAPDTNEVLSVSSVTQPAHGTVTLTGGAVSFTPEANFNGTTVFTYTVSDGNGGVDSAAVTVTVTPVNDPPTANDDSFTVAEGTTGTHLNVLANDTSAPDVGETLSVTAVTQPVNGVVGLTGGLVRFTPTAGFNGTTTFTYTVSDGNGGTDTATVTVTVTPVNDPPDAINDTFTVAEDSGTAVLDVLANDTSAPDVGETLTVTGVTQPAHGTASQSGGLVRFTPEANFHGVTVFSYTISDGNGGTDTATVTVTVTPVNDPPTAVNDSFRVAENSAAMVLDVLLNDTFAPDDGETLTVTSVTQPANGTVELTGGEVRFTPAANFSGTTFFDYEISDGNGGTDTATVTVVVSGSNNPPAANDDAFTVDENSGATVFDVLANDSTAPDTGEDLTVIGVTQPAHGSVTFTAGDVTFTPAVNFSGTTTFLYTVSDGNGGRDQARVTVTVTPLNRPPDAVDDLFTVVTGSSSNPLDVLANDTTAPDTGETLVITAVTQPALGGGVGFTATRVTFTPTAGFTGTTSFTYTVSDGRGGSDTATVTVQVRPVNNPPQANDDSFNVPEDSGAVVLEVLGNDSAAPDAGETLVVTVVTQPAHGTVTLMDGVVQFTPEADYNGTTTFTYTISDGNGGTDTATVTVTVTPVNDPPTANDDTFVVDAGSGPTPLDVLANDTAEPDTGETLTIVSVTQPSQGVVAFTASEVRFTPSAGFSSTTFTYTISDGNGGTDTATVTVSAPLPPGDSDGDGLSDELEAKLGTDPMDDDTDNDGLLDGSEDANHNGVVDADETSPLVFDTDLDGLSDGLELALTEPEGNDTDLSKFVADVDPSTKTAPLDDDTDDDGLKDGSEDANHDGKVDANETNPLVFDTDEDGLSDGLELGLTTPEGIGTDPSKFVADADPSTRTDPLKRDTDAGGVFDGIEDRNHNGRVDERELDPLDPTDDRDADLDGVDNTREEEVGTDPFDNDSDDDGVPDGADGLEDTDGDGRINALDEDSDGDGLFDGTERGVTAATAPSGTNKTSPNFRPDSDPLSKTDPRKADSDGDGLPDGVEDKDHSGSFDNGETDPNKPDTDGDTLLDGQEDANHSGTVDPGETDPRKADTDEGGVNDGDERDIGSNPLDGSDDFIVGGSGCGSTGTSSLVPLALLLGLPLLRRRRQGRGGRSSALAGVCGGMVVLGGLGSLPAEAQSITPAAMSDKIDVQQYKPAPGLHDLLGLHSARVGHHRDWNLGVSLSYAKDPLTLTNPVSDEAIHKLVASQITVDLMGAIALRDRFELGVALPITSQTSSVSDTGPKAQGADSTGLGNLRLVPKAHLLSRESIDLGVALPIHLPTGSADFRGGPFSVHPRALGEWRHGSGVRVLANLGFAFRSKEQLRNLSVSNEFTYGFGAEVPFGKLTVGGSLAGALGLGQEGAEERPLELLAMVKYRFLNAFDAHVGGGPGFTRGYGTPAFRIVAGVSYWSLGERKAPSPKPEEKPVVEPVAVPQQAPAPVCPQGPEDMDGFQDEDGCADPDNDGDGILDASDKCPNAPETKNGFQDEDGCPDEAPPPPPVDTDGDGLTDDVDRCPNEPEDKDGFRDEDGCPDPDNDQDGIADASDKCPNQPETINGVTDEDGCPDKGKVKVLVEREKIVILDKIFFTSKMDVILPKSFSLLKQVAQVLKAHPEIEKVRVEGYTDDQGPDEENLRLSERRAKAVLERLVQEGVAAERLDSVGFGEARPVASNKTSKGRDANRRVEFSVVKVKPLEVERPAP
ncbi:Ig-like domain-containing protein [Stigmatella aurantiaca]|uniref:Thrombospondin type 3 repeat family n=1 Tax=Stigmatella aurantiaca (strain DW4/3-1) TaxID=378806 RepID=Q09BM9_STIAD|nr:Thrombospondin type 3 repeat protein, outer membrane domain protein [Stigmatella aurantiaca DW4/3-1]EAU69121.1 thrombospondin type 3 repeat family [Stigmatella aurantiaca DW4/3-1]